MGLLRHMSNILCSNLIHQLCLLELRIRAVYTRDKWGYFIGIKPFNQWYISHISQAWSIPAGYEELAGVFEPIRNYLFNFFLMNNNVFYLTSESSLIFICSGWPFNNASVIWTTCWPWPPENSGYLSLAYFWNTANLSAPFFCLD